MITYLFYRMHDGQPFFYQVKLSNDAQAVANAECNIGTTKVTRVNGELVRPKPEHKQ